jgi:uncharacterized protein (DUF2147 family)
MTHFNRFGIAAAVAAAMTVVSLAAQGAAQAPAPNVPTPRTANGHPDLSACGAVAAVAAAPQSPTKRGISRFSSADGRAHRRRSIPASARLASTSSAIPA